MHQPGGETRKKKYGHLWGIHAIIRGMKESFIKTQLVEGARDEFVTEDVRIILPCDLPVKVFTGGRVVTIDSGEAMIIPAGTVLGIFSSYKRREIAFDFSIIEAEPAFSFMLPVFSMPFIVKDEAMDLDRLPGRDTPLGHILPVTGDKKPKKRIKEDEPLSPVKMIEFIYDGCENKDEIFGEIKTSILLKTLFIMLSEDALLALSGKDNAEKVSEEMVGHLSKAIDFINENYYRELTLEGIADAAGYARAHMSHIFKKFYGISLFDYLNRVRAYAAARILISPGTTPHEAAEKSGFTSSSNFNRVFKDVMGCAPRDYMKLR